MLTNKQTFKQKILLSLLSCQTAAILFLKALNWLAVSLCIHSNVSDEKNYFSAAKNVISFDLQ